LFDNGSGDNDFVRFYHASNSANSDFFITYDGTGGAEIALKSDGTIKLNESNGDNVCIGNASASAKLDIRQDSGTAIRCEDGSGGYFVVNQGGATGIGTSAPSANADLTLGGGELCMAETTTPTADANFGKIYCKSDNKLYFQDGSGTEHEIAFV
jgi:hypothetical protein